MFQDICVKISVSMPPSPVISIMAHGVVGILFANISVFQSHSSMLPDDLLDGVSVKHNQSSSAVDLMSLSDNTPGHSGISRADGNRSYQNSSGSLRKCYPFIESFF